MMGAPKVNGKLGAHDGAAQSGQTAIPYMLHATPRMQQHERCVGLAEPETGPCLQA